MDFHKLITRYKQFGGKRLILQYVKLGVMPVLMNGFFRCLYQRKSFKAIYSEALRKIEPFLIAKYDSIIQEFKKFNCSGELQHEHPKLIWWCWLQGFEEAPEIVAACYNSLKGNLPEYVIKIVDSENWKEYIELPDYIVKKWEKKQIPPALFSDLLRLQLLIEHGGTWIDSTVLCTGIEYTKEYLDADLFLFQYTRPGEVWSGNISNWFISAHSNNEVLMVLRDMLFAYWRDYNCTLDYYIFHLFFKLVAEKYPDKITAMPYGYSMNSLALLRHWGEKFNQERWDRLTSKVCFHKLAFRVNESVKNDNENYYNHILNIGRNENHQKYKN